VRSNLRTLIEIEKFQAQRDGHQLILNRNLNDKPRLLCLPVVRVRESLVCHMVGLSEKPIKCAPNNMGETLRNSVAIPPPLPPRRPLKVYPEHRLVLARSWQISYCR